MPELVKLPLTVRNDPRMYIFPALVASPFTVMSLPKGQRPRLIYGESTGNREGVIPLPLRKCGASASTAKSKRIDARTRVQGDRVVSGIDENVAAAAGHACAPISPIAPIAGTAKPVVRGRERPEWAADVPGILYREIQTH